MAKRRALHSSSSSDQSADTRRRTGHGQRAGITQPRVWRIQCGQRACNHRPGQRSGQTAARRRRRRTASGPRRVSAPLGRENQPTPWSCSQLPLQSSLPLAGLGVNVLECAPLVEAMGAALRRVCSKDIFAMSRRVCLLGVGRPSSGGKRSPGRWEITCSCACSPGLQSSSCWSFCHRRAAPNP
jgi:hypothetical protein